MTRRPLALLCLFFVVGCASTRPTKTIRINSLEAPPPSMASPLPGATVLSPFGPRGRRFHTGIDIRLSRPGGEPVKAADAGTVIRAGRLSGYGNLVTLKHRNGFQTRYAHLDRIKVKKGAAIPKGTVLGTVGRTGRATAPHLHFEVISPSGRFLDPVTVIRRK